MKDTALLPAPLLEKYRGLKVKENLLNHHKCSNSIYLSLEQYNGGCFTIYLAYHLEELVTKRLISNVITRMKKKQSWD